MNISSLTRIGDVESVSLRLLVEIEKIKFCWFPTFHINRFFKGFKYFTLTTSNMADDEDHKNTIFRFIRETDTQKFSKIEIFATQYSNWKILYGMPQGKT